MELQFLCAGRFTDAVGHLLVGKFDGEDHRNLFFFYFIDQECHGFGAGLGFRGTARECGIIVQSVGVRQIAEGKTVAEDDRIPLGRICHILKFLIQLFQFRNIVCSILRVIPGVFGIDANLTFSAYPFRRDKSSPLLLNAHFETSLKEPDHYQQRLFTNHFRWENDFGKISTTKIEGRLMIPRWNLEAMFGYALLGNNIYYDTDGIVRQNGLAMSVMSAYLRKDFRLWKFHLDHQALFQVSSNPDVLPLPMLALNFRYYLQFDVVKKVMQMQIGANGRYTTRWYAPAYNPVAGVFHNQNEEMYGNCPDIDVFVNIQWKRACIFIKLVNVGLGWPNDQADYFSAHHYILPQRTLKVGIFWPFYIQPGKNARVGGGSGSGGGATGGTGGMTSQRQSIN